MTDFTNTHRDKCRVCGDPFIVEEGKLCDCWKCSACGEEFSDFDMLANREKWLCLYCEDLKFQVENKE